MVKCEVTLGCGKLTIEGRGLAWRCRSVLGCNPLPHFLAAAGIGRHVSEATPVQERDIQTLESTFLSMRKRRFPPAASAEELGGVLEPGGFPVFAELAVAPGA